MGRHYGLSRQYALITGASRGIGLAIAEMLAGQGCNVAITSRKLTDCEVVANTIAAKFMVKTLAIACDVSQQASVSHLFDQFRKWSGDQLSILVCNAGYPFMEQIWNTPLHATPPELLEPWYLNVFRTDTMGSVFCTFEALPLMMAQKSGSLIYISSTPALEGFQGAPYTIAKAGLLGLMKDIAREYGPYGIRANALAVGNIQTPATYDHLDSETKKEFASEAPLRRWGSPQEVAGAVLFLASDLSSFISGQTLVVDGGTVRR